jgi:hypothetical protein
VFDSQLTYWSFFSTRKEINPVVHRQGEDTAESTKQLAEDLMAITTVFVADHHGKQAAEGRRRRKHARGEEKKKMRRRRGKSQEAKQRRFIVFLGLVG